MSGVAAAHRPPRPRSRGYGSTVPAMPPPFALRPARAIPPAPIAERTMTPPPPEEPPSVWKPAALGSPPENLVDNLPQEFREVARSRRPPQPPCLPALAPAPPRVRRSRSEAPPMSMSMGLAEDICCPRPPLIRNVATFEKPKEYAKSLRGIAALNNAVPQVSASSRSSRRPQRSPIDEAIQREFMGEGLALEQAVDARRDAGWAVKHRHLQRSDVGHCCHACRHPLRDMNEEVVVWTGAAIYRRFHPRCAASYMLHADAEKGTSSGSRDAPVPDVVEDYADGWRALRDEPTMGAGTRPQQAIQAARQWLLSQDPGAFPSLRGDLFTTVTITENGKKKAVPGLTQDQLRILQTKHRWHPGPGAECDDESEQLECPVCFTGLDANSSPAVRLPCAPQHVCHIECVWPWLRKASICPVCRKDLRPLLPPARGASMPPLSSGRGLVEATDRKGA